MMRALLCTFMFMAAAYASTPTCDTIPNTWTNQFNSITVGVGTYNLKSKVDYTAKTIDLYLSVTATFLPSWLAFGISEVGTMAGSDIVAVLFSSGSTPSVQDLNVQWSAEPLISSPQPVPVADAYANWELVCATSSGKTLTAIVRRALDTGDNQDRPFVVGNMPIILAFGSTPNLQYHGANRLSTILNMLTASSGSFTPPSDQNGFIGLNFNPSWSTTSTVTQYVCQIVDVGSVDRHIIAFEPTYMGTAGESYVHHIIIHGCGNDLTRLTNSGFSLTQAGPCGMISDLTAHGSSPLGSDFCPNLLHADAHGSGPYSIPAAAGFKVSASGNRYIIVEAHINNPTGAVGIAVNSLAKAYTTTTLRTHDAAMMAVGDPLVTFSSIPAKTSSKHYQGTCTSTCTNKFAGPVNVFMSFPHMHSYGRTIWTTKIPAGGDIVKKELVDYREFWNFGFQTISPVNFTIQKGDRLNTHCLFDTSKSGSSVVFGSESSDEMCMHFFAYYPASNAVKLCGGYTHNGNQVSVCGNLAVLNSFIAETNPISDGETAFPRTPWGSVVPVSGAAVPAASPMTAGIVTMAVISALAALF